MILPLWLGESLSSLLLVAAVALAAGGPRHRSLASGVPILVLVLHAALYGHHTVDDAFITFRYADAWESGLGPVYNAGERVEGYTSFAWMALIAAAGRFGVDPETAARALGILFAAACLPAVYRIALRVTGPRAALVAPFALALSPLFAAWACAGMEAPLFACVIAWTAWAFLGGRALPGGIPLDAAFSGLALWVRPEGVLLVAAGVVARLGGPGPARARLAAALRAGLVAIAVAAPYWAWRAIYYGRFFPNTFYAKFSPAIDLRLATGARSLFDFAQDLGLGWLGPGLIGATLLARPGARKAYIPLVAGLFMLGAVWTGGDVLHLRVYTHVLPLVAVCLATGVGALAAGLAPAPGHSHAGAAALAAAIALAWAGLAFREDARALRGHDQFGAAYTVGNPRNLTEVNIPLAGWLRQNVPAGTSLATWDIGAVGYFSRLRVTDCYGLTDAGLAQLVYHGEPAARSAEYFERNPPELVAAYATPDGPALGWLDVDRAWFQHRYALHSIWRARSSGYALALFERRGLGLPPPPPAAAVPAEPADH